ncbi:cell division protein FtsQ/DivIB [Bartonella sp. LJL80]
MYALSSQREGGVMASLVSVLPRLYRRFRRAVFHFVLADVHIPRHLGSLAVVLFLGSSVAYGVSAGGHTDDVVKATTSTFGFAVEDVEIAGNDRMSELDVLSALGLDGETSMIGFDANAARSVLAELPWVQSVDVQKVYPDRVRVSLVERQPYAVWQHGDQMDIVDRDGRVIVPFRPGLVGDLPLVVGLGAEVKASGFVQDVSAFPQIKDHVRAYVRVGDRRWDILLDNGVRIKLPEVDAMKRLADAVKAESAQGLFSRDVLSVDLRLPDRMTVALSDEALERRNKVVKEEERRLKAQKAGRA